MLGVTGCRDSIFNRSFRDHVAKLCPRQSDEWPLDDASVIASLYQRSNLSYPTRALASRSAAQVAACLSTRAKEARTAAELRWMYIS